VSPARVDDPLFVRDAGRSLDMKLLASYVPRRRPSAAERRRMFVRALFYGAMVVVSIVLGYGYMLVTFVIGVDHRRWVWPWIAATFAAAGLIFLGAWLWDRRPVRAGEVLGFGVARTGAPVIELGCLHPDRESAEAFQARADAHAAKYPTLFANTRYEVVEVRRPKASR